MNTENKKNGFEEKNLGNNQKEITIWASIAGTVSTDPYENLKPTVGASHKQVYEKDEVIDIKNEIKILENKCYECYQDIKDRAIKERIRKVMKNIRFYPVGHDEYFSVTSILSILPEDQIDIPEYQLMQYASAGTITHARVEYLANYGYLIEEERDLLNRIPEMAEHINKLKKGGLGLDIIQGDLGALLTKYPMQLLSDNLLKKEDTPIQELQLEITSNTPKSKAKKSTSKKSISKKEILKNTPILLSEKVIYNHKDKYAGTADLIGYTHPIFKEANPDILTIADIKRTANEEKNFMQMAAYAKGYEEETGQEIKQMVIYPCASGKSKPKQGFSKPIISTEIEYYYSKFLEKKKQAIDYLWSNGFPVKA